MPSRYRSRHEDLLAHLEDVQQKQMRMEADANAFLHDASADEKLQVQKSMRELLLMTPEVTVLCAQTGAVVERIANANEVAEKMTREVRSIDIVQSRLKLCLEQSSQLLNLRNAMAGIRRAMHQHQYPEAATYLKELKEIEAIMPLDVADKLRVDTIENDLKNVIETSFESGLRANDKPRIHVYAPLFQIIGIEYEERGFAQLLQHIEVTIEERLGPLTKGSFSIKELLEHEATVFNDIAATVQEYDPIMQTCFKRVHGNNRLVSRLYAIGESHVVKILSAYMQQRKYADRVQLAKNTTASSPSTKSLQLSPTSRSTAATSSEAENEIALLNDQLNEIALVIQHTQSYERFMRSRVPEEEANDSSLPSSHESELGKTVQELAGFYCYFENDLLTKAARKSFQWEEVRVSSATNAASEIICFPISSAVDEIFYVARNSGLRALATGHSDCAAGVLNMITTVLRDVLGDTMRTRIRNMAAHVKLEPTTDLMGGLLGSTSNQLRDQMQQQVQQHLAKFSKSMAPISVNTTSSASAVETRKELGPEVVMNSLEATAQYITQVKHEFENELPQDFPEIPTHILTCLHGLEESSQELTQLLTASRKKLCKILEPKLTSFLSGLLAPSARKAVQYELSEQMFTFNEANDPFAHAFVLNVRELLVPFKQNLSPTNFGSLVEVVASCTVELIEKWFHSKPIRFNQLGALQFDKDLRVLSAFFGETSDCRHAFARLSQIAMVLNVDAPADVQDFYGRRSRGIEWQLPAAQVKEVLSRRVEFTDSAINKLVLR